MDVYWLCSFLIGNVDLNRLQLQHKLHLSDVRQRQIEENASRPCLFHFQLNGMGYEKEKQNFHRNPVVDCFFLVPTAAGAGLGSRLAAAAGVLPVPGPGAALLLLPPTAGLGPAAARFPVPLLAFGAGLAPAAALFLALDALGATATAGAARAALAARVPASGPTPSLPAALGAAPLIAAALGAAAPAVAATAGAGTAAFIAARAAAPAAAFRPRVLRHLNTQIAPVVRSPVQRLLDRDRV